MSTAFTGTFWFLYFKATNNLHRISKFCPIIPDSRQSFHFINCFNTRSLIVTLCIILTVSILSFTLICLQYLGIGLSHLIV